MNRNSTAKFVHFELGKFFFLQLYRSLRKHTGAYLKRYGFREVLRHFSYKQGLPPGISRQMVASFLCHNRAGKLVAAQFCHVSSWKNAGCYRLRLKSRSCGTFKVIFKNARYSKTDIPALIGLPVLPGLAEYFFFSQKDCPATGFLPAIYHAEEISPKEHYRYLMQDLSIDHRRFAGMGDLIRICKFLPRLQESLRQSLTRTSDQPLFRYDREFDTQLLTYAYCSLKAFQSANRDLVLNQLITHWDEFATGYLQSSELAYSLQPLTVIHGDCNPSNLMIHRRDNSIRVFDLEWSAWGLPHSDLVSVLINAPSKMEEPCLAAFYKSLNRHTSTVDEDMAVLRHARMQRAILNASFLAKQYLGLEGRAPSGFPRFISMACQSAWDNFNLSSIRASALLSRTCRDRRRG